MKSESTINRDMTYIDFLRQEGKQSNYKKSKTPHLMRFTQHASFNPATANLSFLLKYTPDETGPFLSQTGTF
jgi:hypothetical protein